MKNGIIIRGVAYEAHKVHIDIMMPEGPCKLCDYKGRCGPGPCAIFEDNNHYVYFKKVKEE